jgi:hypothetical protein
MEKLKLQLVKLEETARADQAANGATTITSIAA